MYQMLIINVMKTYGISRIPIPNPSRSYFISSHYCSTDWKMYILTHYMRHKTKPDFLTLTGVHYITLQEAVTQKYGAMVEWRLAQENWRHVEKNLLHCQLSPKVQNSNMHSTWTTVFLMNVQKMWGQFWLYTEYKIQVCYATLQDCSLHSST